MHVLRSRFDPVTEEELPYNYSVDVLGKVEKVQSNLNWTLISMAL